MDKCSKCFKDIENLDDIIKVYFSRQSIILCYECYINGVCCCCDEYVPEGELFYLSEPLEFVEYMDKAAKQMFEDGYSDVCFGCLECKADQIEADEQANMLTISLATGMPDLFSDKMRWFWIRG